MGDAEENAGTRVIDSTNGTNATLDGDSVLTNNGTVQTQDTAPGGARTFQVELDNTASGTVQIDAADTEEAANAGQQTPFTTPGPFPVGPTGRFTGQRASTFTHSAGSLVQ